MHSIYIQIGLIITLGAPFLIYLILVISVLCSAWGKGIDVEENVCQSAWYSFLSFIALSTGNMHIMNIDKTQTKSKKMEKPFAKYANDCLFGIFEDLPQFMLQMLNTMLVGQ